MNKIIKITSFLMLFMFIALYKCNFANAETATCVYGSQNDVAVRITITDNSSVRAELIGTWASGVIPSYSNANVSTFVKNGEAYCPKYANAETTGLSGDMSNITYTFSDSKVETDSNHSNMNLTNHSRNAKTVDSSPSNNPTDSSTPGTKVSSNDDCEGIYGKTLDDMKAAIKAFKIIGPIMVMVYTVVEYLGAVTDKDADKLKKANQRLISRFILLLVLFFLPDLINIILKLVGVSSTTNCLK